MRTVDVSELESQLSGYLQDVRNGEEIVIEDQRVPVARILPYRHDSGEEAEQQLVASGAMKLAKEKIDWNQFFLLPAGNVPHEIAVAALIDGRGDR